MRPRHYETGWRHRLCPYNGCVETATFPLFSAQRCTWLYLIKWSTRYYKEEIMTAWNDCFVLQSLEAWSNFELTPGTGTFYLSLFLLSLFQWIAPGWWSPTVDLFWSIHPLKAGLPLPENPPSALSSLVWSVSSNNKAWSLFLRRWFTGAIILWEIHLVLSVNFPSYVYCFLIQFMLSGRYFCLLQMF